MHAEWNVVLGIAGAVVTGAAGLGGWSATFALSAWVAVVCLDLMRR